MTQEMTPVLRRREMLRNMRAMIHSEMKSGEKYDKAESLEEGKKNESALNALRTSGYDIA